MTTCREDRDRRRQGQLSWARCFAWQRGILLGVLFVLMSLCHGVITANAAGHDATNGWETTSAHSKEIPTYLAGCAADTKALVSLDRRFDSIEGDQLVPAYVALPERREQIQFEHISPPSALPHDLQALFQVFRI